MSDFKAKMHTRFDFRWGFAPDPAGGAYGAPKYFVLEPPLRGRVCLRMCMCTAREHGPSTRMSLVATAHEPRQELRMVHSR